jgi:hypothetical protein
LKRAREIENVDLELEIRRNLTILFAKEKELSTGMAKLINYNFEDRTNCLQQDAELRRLGQLLHRRRLRKLLEQSTIGVETFETE